ncbi:MAG TPA: PQQ-binding-like beta-propeller repeat protein [Gemmataceae bacterium]|jgi:outer membrane protein assembly factor BamB|nr:PQQ-binding-like beta-propeller repeat protein [Gemmataceae bacterium]
MLPRWAWCLLCLVLAAIAPAAERNKFQPRTHDWPQWQGPDRNGISHETGLLADWPKDGPPLVWKIKHIGTGYSTPSVAAGRIFGLSWRGKDEVVWALDESTGKELWAKRIAEARPAPGGEAREGSRSTPTVDGDRLYALGQNGDLVCMDMADGDLHWHKNLVKDFHGGVPAWGYSESPLVDGDKLVCTPGGKEATLVALDKKTGDPIWKAQVPQGDGAAYASVIAADVHGLRQYIQFLHNGVVGVAADDGKFLWRYDQPHNGTANCSTPIFAHGCVFAASGYGTGGGLVRLIRKGAETRAEQVYFSKQMVNQHGGMVLVDGYVYGSNEGQLCCLDFKSGKVMWQDRHPGKGSITCADGRLYYRNEGGPVMLVEANPKKYIEHGRFNQPDRSGPAAWPHPVIANGKLYLRDQNLLLCYDVKEH